MPIAHDTRTISGFQGTRFTTTLEGNGYSIDNLYINRPQHDYVRLIAAMNSQGEIRNLMMVNVTVKGGYWHIGAFVGENSGGSISESYYTGTVKNSLTSHFYLCASPSSVLRGGSGQISLFSRDGLSGPIRWEVSEAGRPSQAIYLSSGQPDMNDSRKRTVSYEVGGKPGTYTITDEARIESGEVLSTSTAVTVVEGGISIEVNPIVGYEGFGEIVVKGNGLRGGIEVEVSQAGASQSHPTVLMMLIELLLFLVLGMSFLPWASILKHYQRQGGQVALLREEIISC